ncbi:MAG: Mov34/MPN/PAD-1 family protein [Polyangiaceae bacterium]|nr:Mov34/MPN/PAD-1 family protein [Polyangiaceae bacterium]
MQRESDAPWTRGGLRIKLAALRALEGDARDRYLAGEEACGYVTGPASDALLCDEAFPVANCAGQLHLLDPKVFFRGPRSSFALNEKAFSGAVKRGSDAGRPVKVLYHSHLDASASFSVTDAAAMSRGDPPAYEGGPARLGPGPEWPLAFLVTSVCGGPSGPFVDDHRLYIWSGDRFEESSFRIVG